VGVAELTDLVATMLCAAGVVPDEAAFVAAHVVDAEARENRSQGLVRVPPYVRWARSGEIASPTTVTVERDAGSVLVLDAHGGWGHVAAARAMGWCADRAETTGACVAVVRDMRHSGRLGAYVELAAARGMVGVIAGGGGSRASAWVAPWGGTRPIFGTNPIAIGFPRQDGPPVVADIATTQGARGTVVLAQKTGAILPDNWAFDASGRPTRDPHQALPPYGTLAPLGGHKGYALAIGIEILCAVLAGAPTTSASFVAAFRVEAFLPMEEYLRNLAEFAGEVTAGPRRPGFDAIRLPGEGSAARQAQSAAHGVRVPTELWREIAELAAELRVTHPLFAAEPPIARDPDA